MNYQGVEAPSQAAPQGRYKVKIDKAEAKFSKNSNRPMIALEMEIAEGPHTGKKVWDYLLTDTGGGAYYSMIRLKGLIGNLVKQDIPDSVIAERHLLGLTAIADLTVEERKDASGNVVMVETEDGRQIPATSNKVAAYYTVQAAPAGAGAPQTFTQPAAQPMTHQPMQQQLAQPQYQQAPQQAQYAQQYAPPPAQQFAPQQAQAQQFTPPPAAQVQAQQFNPNAAVPLAQQAPQGQAQMQAPAGAEVMPGFQPGAVAPANAQQLQQQPAQGVPSGGVTPWIAAQAGVQGAEQTTSGAGKRGKKA